MGLKELTAHKFLHNYSHQFNVFFPCSTPPTVSASRRLPATQKPPDHATIVQHKGPQEAKCKKPLGYLLPLRHKRIFIQHILPSNKYLVTFRLLRMLNNV